MNNKGFTLIELLGVVTLLGILLVIAIPAMTKYSGKARNQAYETMSKSLYEGAAARFLDDGYVIEPCNLANQTSHGTEKEMKELFKKPDGSNNKAGAGGCDHITPYDAETKLVAAGYVEPIMAPDKSGQSCEGSVDIIRVASTGGSNQKADDYYYRVWLKCPGREMVTVYTTSDSDGDD